MTLESYITFIIQSIIVTALPGPTILLIIHYSIQYGKQASRFTIPGMFTGDIIALLGTFMGLGALLQLSPNLFSTLKIAGGTYLITLGMAAIRSRTNIAQEFDIFPKPPGRKLFTHMTIVTAFNPQNIIFLLAFFPQFITPSGDYFYQFSIMGISYALIGILVALVFSLMAHKIGAWITKPTTKKYVHLTSGTILCGIGLLTIFL